MQVFEEQYQSMWLYENFDDIDLKINKALFRSKKSIMTANRSELLEKLNVNAAGQIAIKADVIAEREFLNTLVDQDLSGVLYSEESGVKKFGNPEEHPDTSIILLLDPLDGSQNFVKGLPFGCISVAYG
ncbi:MAG: inositol monophosphatase family protein, partial [Candidatus Kariarchaeaceae archaeon]